MKQKVTITFTIEPRDYQLKGDAGNAVSVAIAILKGDTDLPDKCKVRVASGNKVRYYVRPS